MTANAANIAVKEIQQNTRPSRFMVRLAENKAEIEQCLRLRYRVFAQEMGARLSSNNEGLDQDRFDEFCKHLMVFDKDSGKVVATTRLLVSEDAQRSGFFYSETEFDLELVLKQPGRFMEVGRTCIDPSSRKGAVLAILWQGIAEVIVQYNVDYLIGCASISLRNGDDYINSVMHQLRKGYFSPNNLRVRPLIPLHIDPLHQTQDESSDKLAAIPTLLKGYLRQGAMICGEPHWDAEFHVADVFVLLACEKISDNYQRHFLKRA